MKTKIIFLCAIFLATQVITYGQKTEVSVQKGKVIAQTATGEVTVDAGKKLVLEENSEPSVMVDDPLVEAVMEMYTWVQEESANDPNIKMTSIQVHNLISDKYATLAALGEMPNTRNEACNVVRIGKTTLLGEVKFYDLDGDLLDYDFEDLGDGYAYYYIHFKQEVEPGGLYKLVLVSQLRELPPISSYENIYTINAGNCSPSCLNYFRIILPKSAIFLDCTREITSVDSFDGRVALTFRNFTGPEADGMYELFFLWPDKDATSLQDIPMCFRERSPGERGLINKLSLISWTNPGQEILELYDAFMQSRIRHPRSWLVLGAKLIAGNYCENALDVFRRTEDITLSHSGDYYAGALLGQAITYDLLGERSKAIAKYKEVLQVVGWTLGEISHWNIIINRDWVKERLETPFTKKMIGK